MVKYNKSLLRQYINGDEILHIEKYEQDMSFMMEVINMTNDKHFYNLCDDTLKCNYDFVSFLIQKFPQDRKFIYDILEYLMNRGTLNKEQKQELIITMYNLSQKVMDEADLINIKYSMLAASIYCKTMSDIALMKTDLKSDDFLGEGFIYIIDAHRSEIVRKFFAKKMIINLLFQSYYLDAYLHEYFSCPRDVTKINEVMVNCLNNFDAQLGWYVGCHIDILSDFKKDIQRILNDHNWKVYEHNLSELRRDILDEMIVKMNLTHLYDELMNIFTNNPLKNDNNNIKNIKDKQSVYQFLEYAKEVYQIYNIKVLKNLDVDEFIKPSPIKIVANNIKR